MKRLLLLIGLLSIASESMAKVVTRTVEYRQGDTVCQGYLSYDDAVTGKRPAVLIVHDWMGVTDHQKMRAEQLAALGYVALAADVYGKGVRPATRDEAAALAGAYYKDRGLLRARLRAGLDDLAGRPQADASRLAAIGYCFGGAGALELARSGAPLRAVVTFHGSLSTPDSTAARNIRARVLVLHGADDPFVKQDEVQTFMNEMRAGRVDWQVVQYGGAVHSFTDRRAGDDPGKGSAYDEAADRRSWRAMRDFLEETLGN